MRWSFASQTLESNFPVISLSHSLTQPPTHSPATHPPTYSLLFHSLTFPVVSPPPPGCLSPLTFPPSQSLTLPFTQLPLNTHTLNLQARIQISFSGGGGVPPKTHSSYYMILWFPDFDGCKPFTRKVNVSSSNHEDVSTFRTFFFFKFMTVFYINAVQYQTSTISRIR